MGHLETVSLSDLQQALDDIGGNKPTKRLIAAIAYKNGVTQSELADWFGVQRKTIYNWLTRLDEGDRLLEAASDAQRTGRNRKLTDQQLAEFQEALHEPPEKVGYNAVGWSPDLVQRFVKEEFEVDYSIPSCRRLMKEAGLTHQKGDPLESVKISKESETEKMDTGIWMPK